MRLHSQTRGFRKPLRIRQHSKNPFAKKWTEKWNSILSTRLTSISSVVGRCVIVLSRVYRPGRSPSSKNNFHALPTGQVTHKQHCGRPWGGGLGGWVGRGCSLREAFEDCSRGVGADVVDAREGPATPSTHSAILHPFCHSAILPFCPPPLGDLTPRTVP